jgi:hypothetical protein
MTDRQAILAACVKHSRTLADPHDEYIYHDDPSPSEAGIPVEFKALQPKRVNIEADRASIKLHFCFDSGVFIYCEDLNTPHPTATLTWGETGDKETWAAP